MNKPEILDMIERRMDARLKEIADTSRSMGARDHASGAWMELMRLKNEIQRTRTKVKVVVRHERKVH